MKQFSLCLLALIFLLSCHQDSDEVITVIENPDPPAILISTRLVTILENSWIDASPEQVTFAGQTLAFDDVDFNQIKGSVIDRDFELIRIEAANNLNFYKVGSLTENDVNYVHLTLPDLELYQGTTTSTSSFQVAPQTELVIPAGSLQHADSTPYTGPYKIVFASLSSDGVSANCIPSFTGINEHNERQSLLFESCYYITVLSADDVELNFTKDAFLSTPSSDLQEWVFNPQGGVWTTSKNEGPDHHKHIYLDASGYYAIAEAKSITRVKGSLRINGSLTPHYPITIRYAGHEWVVHTTNKGLWAIQLPSEMSYQVMSDLPCGDVQEITLATDAEDEMIAHLEITSDEIENVHVHGTARDCSANPLSENFTVVDGSIKTLLFSELPELNMYIPSCIDGALEISSYNPADGQSGPSISWLASDTINIFSSFACNEARNEYLSLVVSGESKMYWSLTSKFDAQNRLVIEDDATIADIDFTVFVEGLTTGMYEDNMLNILFEDMHLGNRGYSLYCPTASTGCGFTSFTITHFPEQTGQWIRGHFEGRFWIKTFNPLTAGYRPVEGEFQVYREF